MSRTNLMSIGFLLIFLGIQLNVVESFTMTPRISNFLSNNFQGNTGNPGFPVLSPQPQYDTNGQAYNSPYYQASFSNRPAPTQSAAAITPGNRTLYPPRWICWPVLFFGAVMILQGALRG